MISSAGANSDEIDLVAKLVKDSGERITMAAVEKALNSIRNG